MAQQPSFFDVCDRFTILAGSPVRGTCAVCEHARAKHPDGERIVDEAAIIQLRGRLAAVAIAAEFLAAARAERLEWERMGRVDGVSVMVKIIDGSQEMRRFARVPCVDERIVIDSVQFLVRSVLHYFDNTGAPYPAIVCGVVPPREE